MRGHRGAVALPARALARRLGAGMCVTLAAGLIAAASAAAAPNAWSTVGSLATGRVGSVIVVLQSGKVLMAGGDDPSGDSQASSEIYDPSSRTWSPGPNMNEPRFDASAVLLTNGQVLVVGGRTSGATSSTLDTAELYLPGTSSTGPSFKPLTSTLSAGRIGAGIARLADGDVIVVGGTDENGTVLSSTDIYDFQTSKFAAGPSMSTERDGPITTALSNGDVLAAGGDQGGPDGLDTAEVFDPNTIQWTPTANTMSAGREDGEVAPLPGGRELLVGGTDGSGHSTATTDIYDPATNTFTPGASMAQPRVGFGLAPLANGDVLVAGGLDVEPNPTGPPAGLTSTEVYDPTGDAWSARGALPTGVFSPGMVALRNGEVLEAGGVPASNNPTPQASVFDPAFAPGAPTGVTGTPGDGRALVTWTAAAANGEPVSGYTVTASTGQVVTLTGTVTSTTVTDLTNGTPVTFTVTATNVVGTSPASAPSSAVTPTAPPATTATTTPTAPTTTTPTTTPPLGSRPTPDTGARLRLSGLASRMTLAQFLKGLRFTVTPNKAAALQLTLTGTVSRAVISRFNLALASKQFGLSAGKRSVKLVPTRKLVGHPKSAKVQLTIVAVDAAGTRSTVTRTVTIKS